MTQQSHETHLYCLASVPISNAKPPAARARAPSTAANAAIRWFRCTYRGLMARCCAIRNQTRKSRASATPNRGGSSSGCGVICSRQTPRSAQQKRQPAPLLPTTACSKPMRFVLRASICPPSWLQLQPLEGTSRCSCC